MRSDREERDSVRQELENVKAKLLIESNRLDSISKVPDFLHTLKFYTEQIFVLVYSKLIYRAYAFFVYTKILYRVDAFLYTLKLYTEQMLFCIH